MKRLPYTYTVLRYVHDITTGEFANIGVVLSIPEIAFVGAKFRNTHRRISANFPGLNGEHFRNLMRFLQNQFEKISFQYKEELHLGETVGNAYKLAMSVLPQDDSSYQWSPMGSGLTENPEETVEKLYHRQVEFYDQHHKYSTRTDDQIWSKFRSSFKKEEVINRFGPKTISGCRH
jgi:hypothetical protein